MRTKLIYNTAMDASENKLQATSLSDVALNCVHHVSAVIAPVASPEWATLLNEIGFLPGETVTVTAPGIWGQDPLVVRVGVSTFAIRRAEARCILVTPAHPATLQTL